jgi:hypothetical protein
VVSSDPCFARRGVSHVTSTACPRTEAAWYRTRQLARTPWVNTIVIDPGSPWQNAGIESFNSRLRDERLNGCESAAHTTGARQRGRHGFRHRTVTAK